MLPSCELQEHVHVYFRYEPEDDDPSEVGHVFKEPKFTSTRVYGRVTLSNESTTLDMTQKVGWGAAARTVKVMEVG